MNTNRLPVTYTMFLLCVIATFNSVSLRAQTDEIQLKPIAGQTTGRIVRGTITAESPREIKIQVGTKTETITVDDLADVDYAGTPQAFLEAEQREKSGDLNAALESYKRAASAAGLKPFVAQLVKFKYATALADAGMNEPQKLNDSITALQQFVKSYPNGRHTALALERLLNLVRSGSDQSKIDSVLTDMANIPGNQGRANILKAELLAEQGQAEKALQLLDTAKSQIPKNSELERLAESTRIKVLVARKDFTEAEKLARTLIESSVPNDAAALAPAYNSLGDCLRAAGKPKDAMIAYLHTEILYDRVAGEHARALAAITQLWRVLEKPDRAEQTLNKLASTYPRSPWVKAAQGVPKP